MYPYWNCSYNLHMQLYTKLYPNQKVKIVPFGKQFKITAIQENSTPGIYSVFQVFPQEKYKIILEARSVNQENEFICWTSDSQKKYCTCTPIKLLKFTKKIEIDYIHNSSDTYLSVGIFFSFFCKDDYFILKSIHVQPFDFKEKTKKTEENLDVPPFIVNVFIDVSSDENNPVNLSIIPCSITSYLQEQPLSITQKLPMIKKSKKPDSEHEKPDSEHEKPDSEHEKPDSEHEKPDSEHEKPDSEHEKPDLESVFLKQSEESVIYLSEPFPIILPQNPIEMNENKVDIKEDIKEIIKSGEIVESSNTKNDENIFYKSIYVLRGKCLSFISSKILESKSTYYWESNNKNKITLTVALPTKNSKKIIWLALESLRRQTNITFFWELIIWDDGENSFSVLKEFIGKLPGCCRIVYRYIHATIFPLIDKWIGIAGDASITSNIYVLQAADCYSPPKRLFIHNEHFKNKNCLFSNQKKGLFFNLKTKQKMFYAPFSFPRVNPENYYKTHLNMALRTYDMIRIKSVKKKKGIDNYILNSVKKLYNLGNLFRNHIFYDSSVHSVNWTHSVDTDGTNMISTERKNYYKNMYPSVGCFLPYTKNITKKLNYQSPEKHLPKNVWNFLIGYK
jgi:hypothetical protein